MTLYDLKKSNWIEHTWLAHHHGFILEDLKKEKGRFHILTILAESLQSLEWIATHGDVMPQSGKSTEKTID